MTDQVPWTTRQLRGKKNHLGTVWRRPYVAKQVVSTDSGTPKIAKNPQFLTLDSRISTEGCFEHEKIAKNHQFFWRFLLIFALSKKRPYVAKRIVSTILRTLSGTKNAKNPQFWTLDPCFPQEGCTGPKKTCKIPPVFNTRQPDSRRGLLAKK